MSSPTPTSPHQPAATDRTAIHNSASEAAAKEEIARLLAQQPCPDSNSSRGPTTCECWYDYRDINRMDLTEAARALLSFRISDEPTQKQHAGRMLREGKQYKKQMKGRARKHKCYKMTGLPHRLCRGKLTQILRHGNDWLVTAEREADPDQTDSTNPATLRSRKSAKRRKLAELLGHKGPILYYWKQPLHHDRLQRLQQMIRDLIQKPGCDIGAPRKETIFEPKESMGFSSKLTPGRNFPLLHAYATAQFADQSLLPDGKELRLLADGIQYKHKTQCINYSEFPVLQEIQKDTLATLRRRKKRLFLGEAIRALPPSQEQAWAAIIKENPANPYNQKDDRSGDPFAVSLAAMSLHVQSDWQKTKPSVYMPHIDIFGEFVCFVQIHGRSFTFVSERSDDPSRTEAYFEEQDDNGNSWKDYSEWKRSLQNNNPEEHEKVAAYEAEFARYVNNEARSRQGRLFRIRVFLLTPGDRLAFAAGKSLRTGASGPSTQLTTNPVAAASTLSIRNIPTRINHSATERRRRHPRSGGIPLPRLQILTRRATL